MANQQRGTRTARKRTGQKRSPAQKAKGFAGRWQDLRARLAVLQSRIEEEGRTAARAVDGTVRGALAALDIPSRTEIAALTRQVEELSRKLESRKR